MSEDEVGITIVSSITAGICWLVWYWGLIAHSRREYLGRPTNTILLWLAPVAAAIQLAIVLRVWSSHDVRDSGVYTVFYELMGLAWTGLFVLFIPWFGISIRDDVFERQNGAAAWVAAGAVLGIMASFSGANIGDGPGWWVVLFCGLLSTGSFLLLWRLFESLTSATEAVIVDRDLATGIRMAGWMLASGLILGASVAGDWKSATATIRDFLLRAIAVVPLLILAIVVELKLRPSPQHPNRSPTSAGVAPLLIYLGIAAVWILLVGLEP
jgi:hypothetical protein